MTFDDNSRASNNKTLRPGPLPKQQQEIKMWRYMLPYRIKAVSDPLLVSINLYDARYYIIMFYGICCSSAFDISRRAKSQTVSPGVATSADIDCFPTGTSGSGVHIFHVICNPR